MKKILSIKKEIFGFILGIVFSSCICVSAAIVVGANEVSLSSTKTSNTNVKSALDELYDKAMNGSGRTYFANEVTYSTTRNASVSNLQEALDDLLSIGGN